MLSTCVRRPATPTTPTFSPAEREAIALQIAIEAINSLVNREIFRFSSFPDSTKASFSSLSQGALFSVLLADILEPVDARLLGQSVSLLDILSGVASSPCLGSKSRARKLQSALRRLRRWLDKEVRVLVWLPSIDTNIRLRIRRSDYISICGNIAKHNSSRLTGKARRLQQLLAASGKSVDATDALRVLDDFQGHFHTDLLVFHATSIAEMLNYVRWAIHEYLQPRFARSYVPPTSVADPRYSFKYPTDVVNQFGRDRFWDIMNSVRSGPWIARFKTAPTLKNHPRERPAT